MKRVLSVLILMLIAYWSYAEVEIRQTFILSDREQQNFRKKISNNINIKLQFDTIFYNAQNILNKDPQPIDEINYEGLLDTDPLRQRTESCLEDMDHIALLLFAYYGTGDLRFMEKVKKMVIEWVNTYIPTGNPINENKLEPLIHASYVFRSFFSEEDRVIVERWLEEIASKEIENTSIPNNNWRSKQIKLIGTIGYILKNEKFIMYAKENYRDYIDSALFGDGTSRDLHHRDAMSYHVSGLKPLLVYGLIVSRFEPDIDFRPFNYRGAGGGSVEKALDFVVPYALGEKEYKQWRNSEVELDRERAKAGIDKYQPGTIYDPQKSLESFEMGWYFKKEYKTVLDQMRRGGVNESLNFTLISVMNL